VEEINDYKHLKIDRDKLFDASSICIELELVEVPTFLAF